MGEDILERKHSSKARRHGPMWCIQKLLIIKDGGRTDWEGNELEGNLVPSMSSKNLQHMLNTKRAPNEHEFQERNKVIRPAFFQDH